jgi:hypothetical protein
MALTCIERNVYRKRSHVLHIYVTQLHINETGCCSSILIVTNLPIKQILPELGISCPSQSGCGDNENGREAFIRLANFNIYVRGEP